MKQRMLSAIKAAVTLGLLAWLLMTLDLGRLAAVLAEAAPIGFCALVGIYFGNKCIAAYRWHWMLRCNGAHPPFGDVLRWSLVGGAISAALPFGAAGTEVARVAAAARDRWKISLLAIAAFVDRLIGVTTLALIVLIGSRVSPVSVPGVGLIALALLAASGLGVLAAVRRWDLTLAAGLPERLRRWTVKPLDTVHAAVLAYRDNPAGLAYGFVITVGFQFARVGGAYAGCLTLGIDVPFSFLLATFPLVIFANMLPISLNGIGVREVGLVYALGFAGIGAEQAAALGLVLSAMNVIANLPGLALLLDSNTGARNTAPRPKPGNAGGPDRNSEAPKGSTERVTTRSSAAACDTARRPGGSGPGVISRSGAGGR